MKALFICEKKDVFENVYGSKTKEKIKELAYTDMNVYTKAEIMSDKSLSKDTEYLFSTWKKPLFARIICDTVYSATGTAFAAQALNTSILHSRKGLAKNCTVPAE